MPGIYLQSGISPLATGVGDFGYFGMTHRDAIDRLSEHFDDLKRGQHSNQYIQDFYTRNGPNQMYTQVVIECDAYYLNTLEKAYIQRENTNVKYNAEGWNKSAGGEGAKKHRIPYSFEKCGVIHQGDNLLQFLTITGLPDPSGFVMLQDGRLNEYEGFKIY
jgi:hypothetical protein